MSGLEFSITAARVICTLVGLVVLLMWLAGCLELANFTLEFELLIGTKE